MPGGLHPPPAVIASWPKPNFVDPEVRGNGLLVGSLILVTSAFLVVCARLWSRLVILHQGGIDDILIVVAMMFSTALLSVVTLATGKFGWDRHVWDVNPNVYVPSHLNNWIGEILFAVGTGITKVSILLFYRRLAANTYSPLLKRAILGTLWFVIAYSTTFTLVVIFYCWPIEAYWKQFSYPIPYNKKYKCLDEGRSIIVCAVMSILTDFLTTLLPLLIFTGLKMPRRQKISLGIVFGLGFIVCVAGIVRTVYLYELFHETYDVTWVGYPTWAWTFVEANLAIICASAPALKPFFSKFLAATTSKPVEDYSGSGSDRKGNRIIKSGSKRKSFFDRTMSEDIEMMVAGAGEMGKVDKKSTVVTHVQAQNASNASIDGSMDLDQERVGSKTRLGERDHCVTRKTTIDVRYDYAKRHVG